MSDVLQQQTGNLADSSYSQLASADRKKHYADAALSSEKERFAQDKVIQPQVKTNNLKEVQPKVHHTDRSLLELGADSYQSVTEQELQQIRHGTAEDRFCFVEKRERDVGMRVPRVKDRGKKDEEEFVSRTGRHTAYSMYQKIIIPVT